MVVTLNLTTQLRLMLLNNNLVQTIKDQYILKGRNLAPLSVAVVTFSWDI